MLKECKSLLKPLDKTTLHTCLFKYKKKCFNDIDSLSHHKKHTSYTIQTINLTILYLNQNFVIVYNWS